MTAWKFCIVVDHTSIVIFSTERAVLHCEKFAVPEAEELTHTARPPLFMVSIVLSEQWLVSLEQIIATWPTHHHLPLYRNINFYELWNMIQNVEQY